MERVLWVEECMEGNNYVWGDGGALGSSRQWGEGFLSSFEEDFHFVIVCVPFELVKDVPGF